jgi:phosphopantothenate--cysteine ligase
MKLLITAGGTLERIDQVRHITNNSTGALGRAIVGAFLSFEQVQTIFYVCGAAAAAPPDSDKVRVLRITDVRELQDTLERLFSSNRIDGIVHCMAVSDYTVDNVTTSALLASGLAGELPLFTSGEQLSSVIRRHLHGEAGLALSGKISSDMDDMLVVLKKTPKIISMLRRYQPQAVLVGFKLLSGVAKETLIEAGSRLLQKNDCDLVFANDLSELSPTHHCGYLIQSDGSYERLEGRERIARSIAKNVVDSIAKKEYGE